MKPISLLFFLFLLPTLVISQDESISQDTSKSSNKGWEGGLFLGYSNYLGDLVEPTFTLDQANPAFGVFIKNRLSNRFGIKANLFYGRIEGSDVNYDRNVDRNIDFESSLVEIAIRGEYELRRAPRTTRDEFEQSGKYKKKIVPYIFLGLGAAFVNPDVNYNLEEGSPATIALKNEDANADFSNTQFALPIGAGLRIDLSRKAYLGLEWGQRITASDYLDGVKESGDSGDNDIYLFGGATVGFRFVDKDSDNDGVADDNDKCPTQPGPAALGGCPDRDNDGLADRDDSCPDEAGEARLNGCPDADGDGVADNVDDCPDEAGLRRFSGCPDSDNDGIVDKEDNCPSVAGIPAMNGCPDADRDGITDDKDNCPETPGVAEHGGCPDSDNDGIADNEDSCPTTPGIRRFSGCPDTDNDGIADNNDRCPTLAGPTDNDGCPKIAADDQATLDRAMQNVNFETGSARLLNSSRSILDEIAEVVTRYPGYNLFIDGYTDSVGNDFANQQLSENRTNACADYLASKGVTRSLMITTGHGENDPIADNSTSTGRRKNRRVTFRLVPQ